MFPHILCQNSMKSPAYSSRPHQKLAKNGLKCPQIKKWYKTDPNWNLIFHSLSIFLTFHNVHKLRNCKVVDFWSWRVGEVSGNTVWSSVELWEVREAREPMDSRMAVAFWELREPRVAVVVWELREPTDSKVAVTMWELREPREPMDPRNPRLAVSVWELMEPRVAVAVWEPIESCTKGIQRI